MKLSYRPEIDGLRAIAVGAVILYHSQIKLFGHQPFKGGFIGVDIFFVISGYLITSIILKELVSTGNFSFKYFYERRIRRILPALLFVMFISFIFAWIFLLPSSFIDFSKSILYSQGFSSNFYFHYSGQQYDDPSSLLKPFLHTWSLSVEEQYYIIFPVVLIFIYKFFRKYLIHFFIISFIVSLGLAEWGSRNYPSATFYFIHTRVWELLAGSLLAYFEIKSGSRSKSKKLNLIFPFVGLVLIVHSILFFNHNMLHPSFFTLSPVIGVCLIIWYSSKEDLITKILSLKMFVGIGLISYSLYLWHYPIFAFYRYIKNSTGNYTNVIIVFIILLSLSIFSYFFIEKPFRKKRSKKFSIKIIFISIVIISFANLLIIFNDGYKDRFKNIFLELDKNNIKKPWQLLKDKKGEPCFSNENLCFFNTDSKKRVFLIGDSHIASINYDLKKKILNKNKYSFIVANRTGCIYFPGFDLIKIKSKKKTGCNNDYFLKLEKLFSEKNDNIIIVGGRLPFYISQKTFDNGEGGREYSSWFKDRTFLKQGKFDKIEDSFRENIELLSKNNKIILVYPIPENGWNVPRKLYLQLFFEKNKNNLKDKQNWITTSYDIFKKRSQESFELLNSIRGKNIYRVYPHELFCDTLIKSRCISHNDQSIFYSDDDHPSLVGAEMINNMIMKEIDRIEK
mgnify:FL=1